MRGRFLPMLGLAAVLPGAAMAACAAAGGTDLCTLATNTAAAVTASLPRELKPGVRAEAALPEGTGVRLKLLVAADLRLPDADGFAALACADPDLSALIAAGGSVEFDLNSRILAVTTTCPKVN
jgi:hypothetical protein